MQTRPAPGPRTSVPDRRRAVAPRARRVVGPVLALLVAAGVALLGAAPASAHAQFTGSDPAEGASLPQLPAAVVMSYSEDIAEQFVDSAVIAPDGTTVPTTATVEGTDVSIDLTAAEVTELAGQGGGWQVVARVVSVDGHPVEHTTTFDVAEPASQPGTGSGAASGDGPDAGATAGSGVLGAAVPAASPAPADSAEPVDPAAALADGLPRWVAVLGSVVLVAAVGAALLVQLRRRPPQD